MKELIKGLVSIIIPVYNKKEYIEECIERISEQTYKKYEVIIVDDGSTDGSSVICDNIAKKYTWVRVIHKKNGGVSSARNLGIRESNGEWICFIDVDDYPLSKMLEKMVRENADLVVCNWSDEKRKYCSNKFKEDRQECTIRNNESQLLCTPDFFKTIWNKLFRTDILLKNEIKYEEEICHAEDSIFSIDYYSSLNKDAKIVLIKEPLYFHRRNVKGSLVKDHDVVKWRRTANYWWKHVENVNFSDDVRNDMLVRCLQNEFLVFAMERNYKGLKNILREKKHLITIDSVKYWPKIKRMIFLTKNSLIIYLANRIWCYLM